MHWKKLSTKVLLEHPRLRVVEDQALMPNGDTASYIRFDGTRNTVAVIAHDDGGNYLVQHEYAYPIDTILTLFPAGGVEAGETPEEAAIRELAEEGGVIAEKLALVGQFFENYRRETTITYVFAASGLSPTSADGDVEEEIERFTMTYDEIEQAVGDGTIAAEHTIASWSMYRSHRSKN